MKKKITALCLCVALLAIAVVGASLAYFTDKTENVQNTFTMGGVKINLTEPEWNPDADHTLLPGISYAKDPTITLERGSADSYVFLEMSFNKYSSLLWVMAADASADDDIPFTIFNEDGSLMDVYKNANGVFSTTNFLNTVRANKPVFQAIVNKWFGGITHTDWEQIYFAFGNDNEVDNKMLTVRLAYIGGENDGILKAGDSVTFMTSFGMPASVTQEMIDNGKEIGHMKNAFNTDAVDLKINFKAYAVQAEGFDSASQAWNETFGK